MSAVASGPWLVRMTCPRIDAGSYARRARGGLGAHPGCVEELDEGEGEEDEHERNARGQHHHGEEAPQVTLKGDVPESEGRHDGERPVEPRHPAVALPFQVHEEVKEDAVNDDQPEKNQKQIAKRLQILPARPALEHRAQDGDQRLHCAILPRFACHRERIARRRWRCDASTVGRELSMPATGRRR